MSQKWDANQYIDHASFVAEYGLPVLSLLNPVAGERILDLGCGDGSLTKIIKDFGVDVHGIDSSQSMVDKALSRGLSAETMSGERLTFQQEFDAVFSNAALHWMLDVDSVLTGVHQALRPNGRFVGEFGSYGNVQTLVEAIDDVFKRYPEYGNFVNPWYFPTIEEYQNKLEEHGFKVQSIEIIARPTPLQSGLQEWLKIFAAGIIENLDLRQQELFLNAVEEITKPHLLIDNQWIADYVRLRFSAQKI